MWRQFSIALSFLTVFHLPIQGEITLFDSAICYSCFPLVGFLVGLSTLALAFLLQPVVPPVLLAVWVCAFMTLVTRGFHLDGLADLADGVGGGYTPKRRLEIMKDSATGTFGSLALIFAVFFKVAAIHTLILAKSWTPLALVPAVSRFAIVLIAYKSTYARAEGGLAKACVDHLRFRTVLVAALLVVCLGLLLTPRYTPVYLGTAILISLLMRSLSHRWIKGITGDVLGATNELTEIFLYTLSACFAY